jgi:hypothetical protein
LQLDKPNVEIVLAPSYNTRGSTGFTHSITNGLDQRLINCSFEILANSITGRATVYVVKRPGVADVGSTYGTTGQVAYLWDLAAGALTNAAANRWVFSTDANDIRASDTSTTTVIATAASYAPAFVDRTQISGTDTVVLQIRHTDGTQQAWYSTTIGTWTQITDATFTNLAHQGKMEHLNGFAHIATRNRLYSSDVNSLSAWADISFLNRQITQDIGTGLARLGSLIVFFGTETMECYQHNPQTGTGSPLEAVPSLTVDDVGLPSTIVTGQRHYYTTLGGRLYWRGTPAGVYAFDGQHVETVSTPAIAKILAERQHYFVGRTNFKGQRAVVIGLDLPSAATQRALLFFPDLKVWVEFSSTVVIPQSSPRLEDVFLGVGANQHKLYAVSQSTENWQDAGSNYTRTIQFRLPTSGGNNKFMAWCGLVGTQERSACTETVAVSDNDGQNFTTVGTIDRTTTRQYLFRMGAFRDRTMRLTNTSNHEGRLEKFVAKVA